MEERPVSKPTALPSPPAPPDITVLGDIDNIEPDAAALPEARRKDGEAVVKISATASVGLGHGPSSSSR
jgi:hypothetical protein